MSEAIDDLTVTYEENGQTLIKELDKVISAIKKVKDVTNVLR